MMTAVMEQRPPAMLSAAAGDASISGFRWTRSLAAPGSPSRRRSRASTARRSDFALSSRWRRFSDMGRDDFRRELRDGFESIAGPPDSSLTARVHSALVEAPE